MRAFTGACVCLCVAELLLSGFRWICAPVKMYMKEWDGGEGCHDDVCKPNVCMACIESRRLCTLPITHLCRSLVLEDGSVWHGTAFGYTGVEGKNANLFIYLCIVRL